MKKEEGGREGRMWETKEELNLRDSMQARREEIRGKKLDMKRKKERRLFSNLDACQNHPGESASYRFPGLFPALLNQKLGVAVGCSLRI